MKIKSLLFVELTDVIPNEDDYRCVLEWIAESSIFTYAGEYVNAVVVRDYLEHLHDHFLDYEFPEAPEIGNAWDTLAKLVDKHPGLYVRIEL